MGRKHLKTFSCEEERDRARAGGKKSAVAGRGFLWLLLVVVVVVFQTGWA